MELLTTSAQRAYRACPRAYYLGYDQGYRAVHVAESMAEGSLGHVGLEAWWNAARALPDHSSEWLEAALAAVAKSTEDAYRGAKTRALLVAYHETHRAMLWNGESIRALAVEAEFSGPLINPETGAASRTWAFGGKVDAICAIGGRVYVVEHKFTSEDIGTGSHYWARLRLDSQVSNYHVGLRSLGYQPDGCLYDVVRRPALQPHKATPIDARKYTKSTKADPVSRLYANQREADETPVEFHDRILGAIAVDPRRYFDRCEVVRFETEERDAAFDVWQTGQQIRESQRLKRWPRNTDACMRYGRECVYFGVCTGAASLEDPALFRRTATPHEELTMGRAVASAAA